MVDDVVETDASGTARWFPSGISVVKIGWLVKVELVVVSVWNLAAAGPPWLRPLVKARERSCEGLLDMVIRMGLAAGLDDIAHVDHEIRDALVVEAARQEMFDCAVSPFRRVWGIRRVPQRTAPQTVLPESADPAPKHDENVFFSNPLTLACRVARQLSIEARGLLRPSSPR
eukprot:9471569-Pyramimonas_sp.AAC.1